MKKLMLAFILFLSMSFALAGAVELEMIVEPEQRLTTKWQIVIDTSQSTKDIFPNVRGAFLEALSFPTDQLKFSVITFNNRGMHHRWPDNNSPVMHNFTVDELELADRFIATHAGVNSYGVPAIQMAIENPEPNLSVILITDGGFSEVTMYGGIHWDRIDGPIAASQEWRKARNLPEAIITVIGIENKHYLTSKPSDEECQRYLRTLGERWHGGYFLVRE